jgi:hypothetical protein
VSRVSLSLSQGVVNAAVGQENGSREHLKIAQQYFQLVGGKHRDIHILSRELCVFKTAVGMLGTSIEIS